MSCCLRILSEVDLGLQRKAGLDAEDDMASLDGAVLSSADIEHLQPRVAKDFTLFLNLVEFMTYFLSLSPHAMFKPWAYVFFKQVVTGSNRHPSVSGFYKLLTVGLFVAEDAGVFNTALLTTAALSDVPSVDSRGSDTDAYCAKLVSKFAQEVRIEIGANTVGYLSFGPMAQCVVHALKGLACRARVTPASSPASHCKQCLGAHVAFAPRARLHQSFSRTLTSQKTLSCFQWVQNVGTLRYCNYYFSNRLKYDRAGYARIFSQCIAYRCWDIVGLSLHSAAQVVSRLRQYKEELLVSCVKFILALPVQLSSPQVASLALHAALVTGWSKHTHHLVTFFAVIATSCYHIARVQACLTFQQQTRDYLRWSDGYE